MLSGPSSSGRSSDAFEGKEPVGDSALGSSWGRMGEIGQDVGCIESVISVAVGFTDFFPRGGPATQGGGGAILG